MPGAGRRGLPRTRLPPRTEGPGRFVTRLATAVAHVFYRVDVIGAPPAAGPLILLPNHPNALLDPAIVLATAKRPVRFLAKSTLFRGPFAPLLKAASAIPVYRRQDTTEVGRNAETFVAVEAALARGEAICIFPEGISHSTGMLEPLRTGAARMALSAAAAGLDVRLVPVGINLEQKTAFRSRVTIAYGPALAVPSIGAAATGTADVQALTSTIAEYMRSVIVEAEPTRDAALVDRLDRLFQSEREPAGPEEVLARRRTIAEGLQRLRRDRPEWYEQVLVQFRRYDERLRRFGMADAALDWNVSRDAAWRFVLRELPAAVGLVPIGLLATLIFAVPYVLTAGAGRLSRHMDVTATAKAFGGMLLYGTWIALLSGLAGWQWGTAGALAALVLLPGLAVAGLFAVERETSAWQTMRAWLGVRNARPATRRALKRRRAELASVMEQVYEWMAGAERRGP